MTYHIIDEVSKWAIYTATVAALGFPVVYSRAPWRRSAVGRGLMTLAVAIAAILTLTSLRLLNVPIPAPHHVYALLYVLLAIALWRHLLVLVAVQRGRRKDRQTGD